MIPRTGTYSVEKAIVDSGVKYYSVKSKSKIETTFNNPEIIQKNGFNEYSHTHSTFGQMYSSFGSSYKYFTVLRDPVQRFISLIQKVQETLQLISPEIPIVPVETYVKALAETGFYKNIANLENREPLKEFFSKLNISESIIDSNLEALTALTPLLPQIRYTNNNDKRIKYFQLDRLSELEKYLRLNLGNDNIHVPNINQSKITNKIQNYKLIENFVYNEYEKIPIRPLL